LVESYDIHGLEFRIEAEDAALLAAIPAGMGVFSVPDNHGQSFVLDLHYGTFPQRLTPPANMQETLRCQLAAGIPATFYSGPGVRRIDLPGRLSADIDLAGNHGSVCVEPGSEPWIYDMGILPAVVGALRRSGRFTVHAACLAMGRDGQEPAAAIILGQSQAGKSTSALALAHAGLMIQTDELCVLYRGGPHESGAMRVWGMPRPCRVRPYTLQLLPWLRDYPLKLAPDGEELTIEPAELHGAEHDPRFGDYRPGLVVLLDPRNSTGHVANPISSAAALMRIARENVRSVKTGADPTDAPAFEALAALVRQTPVCRLSVGPQLDGLLETLLPWGRW
jgi:hypothetical protein